MKKNRTIVTIFMTLLFLFFVCGSPEVSFAESERDTINLVLNQVIENLNPFGSTAIITIQLNCQIYETLFFLNDVGDLESRLAESYEMGEDGKTYIVKLRKDVKFHNGKSMTAEDVAWSLNFALKTGPFIHKRANLTNFDSARAIDEYTVEIKSTDQSSTFIKNLSIYAYILCEQEFLDAMEKGTLGVEWVPYGTGPYVITSYSPDSEIKLQAFPDYYRGKARIDKINYKFIADNNTITVAFRAGDLDLIVVPTASWGLLNENPDFTTFMSPTNHTSFFPINTNNDDPLSNKLVRQAMSYAVDREGMCFAAMDGIAQPAYSIFNADTVFGGFTVQEMEAAGIPAYQYNPEKAKELLAEAGYPDGVHVGTILTINGSYWEKMSTIFQANLDAIGIGVNIELADSAACRTRRRENNFQIAGTGENFSPDASFGYIYFRYLTPEQRAQGLYSDINVRNRELDDLYHKAMTEPNDELRRAHYLEICRIVQDEMYIIPTFHKAIPYAYHKDLVCDQINTNYYYVYEFAWK